MEVEDFHAGRRLTEQGAFDYAFFVLEQGRVRVEQDGRTIAPRAAVAIASGDGASYRQYVRRRSALRNENSQWTPSSPLISSISWMSSFVRSSCSANVRSIMYSGMRGMVATLHRFPPALL